MQYRLTSTSNPQTKEKGYYARPVIVQTLELKDLADHMHRHNSTYSTGAIFGLITDMVACVTELAVQGYAVKIPDLGIFSVGLDTKMCSNLNEWNEKKYVKGAYLNYRATGDGRPINLTGKVTLQEATDYASPLPKTGTTDSGNTDNGSGSGSGNTGGTSYEVIDDGTGSGTSNP